MYMKRILSLLCLLALLLCGCAQEPFGAYTLDGGAICRVYGGSTGIRRVEVTAADGVVQTFKLKSPDIEPDGDGGVELVDLDFDGHLDLMVKSKQYANGDIRYACYLWRDGMLTESAALSRLRGLAADAETQTLTAWESYTVAEERESRTRLTYAWLDGQPVTVRKVELIHYLAEDENIYCRIESAAEPGQALEVVEEKWIFPEQFDESQIWN